MCKKTVVEKIGFSVLQKQRLIMEKGVSNAGAILTKIDSVVHYMYQFWTWLFSTMVLQTYRYGSEDQIIFFCAITQQTSVKVCV